MLCASVQVCGCVRVCRCTSVHECAGVRECAGARVCTSVWVCRWHPGGMWVCECVGVQVCLHMHVLLCIRRVVIAPVRTNSSCEELVSMEGSVPPTARVWSHSGLAKYTAAGSLISAADISKQHKNVGAIPSPLPSPPSCNRPGLTNKSAHAASREQVQLWAHVETHTHVCIHVLTSGFLGYMCGKVWAVASGPAQL